MKDIVDDLQKAIADGNYHASGHLFDRALKDGCIPELAVALEKVEEDAQLLTLELRDHIFTFLGMRDIYFAVQIPSINVLRILHENNIVNDAQIFMIDFIRNLLESKDTRFAQFCINVETISNSQYAILVPSILDQRMEELENCKIQYTESSTRLYCSADLLDTYYGRKIVSATHGHRSFDVVVNEEQFNMIHESLTSTGLDISSMLENIDPDLWDEFLKKKRKPRIQQGGSGELSVLHRVKSARSNMYATVFRQQVAALNAINIAKTQLCNDILMSVAADPSHQMRRRVLKQLGESGDSIVMDFLADLMKTDANVGIRTEAARAYSVLASRSQLSGMTHISPQPSPKISVLDISKINKILNNLIAKGMPTTMVDDTLISIAIQGGPASVEILTRLLSKPQISVRSAVIKASRSLDNDTAVTIVRAALSDDSPEIVVMAEREMDTRWPDVVWD
ncbi:MAG: HEAT repeat domain-containing protein [Candidatus Thorarchaeota archaeon]